jgi:F0F1-type ATP synthase membrane subunit b/b'
MSQNLIESLEQSNRRWKRLAFAGWAAFALLLLIGVVGLAASLWVVRQGRTMAEEARQQVQEAREKAEALRNEMAQQREAAEKKLKGALKDVEELRQKDGTRLKDRRGSK